MINIKDIEAAYERIEKICLENKTRKKASISATKIQRPT